MSEATITADRQSEHEFFIDHIEETALADVAFAPSVHPDTTAYMLTIYGESLDENSQRIIDTTFEQQLDPHNITLDPSDYLVRS